MDRSAILKKDTIPFVIHRRSGPGDLTSRGSFQDDSKVNNAQFTTLGQSMGKKKIPFTVK